MTKEPKSRNRGFTLIEMIVVIALILTLVSILLPMAINKLSDADNTSADATISGVAVALTNFFKDVGHFPTCDATGTTAGTGCDPFSTSTGIGNGIIFLAFGEGNGSLRSKYPTTDIGSGTWDLEVNDDGATPAKNNGYNHLIVNDPDADGTANKAIEDYSSSATSGGTSKFWRGPYLARSNLDPWGRTFIAYVGAMEKDGKKVSGAGSTKQQGWILSAGPNNKLDTLPTSLALSSDDRGFIFFNAP